MGSTPVIRGSGVSLLKPEITKHTVSHVVAFDPRFSNPKALNCLTKKCDYGFIPSECAKICRGRGYHSSCSQIYYVGRSGLFTADSDGEVIWDLDISLQKYGEPYKYIIALYLTPKPEHEVHFFAAVQTMVTEPFAEKPRKESYTVIKPDQMEPTKRIRSQFSEQIQLENNNLLCRIDLTYLIYTMDNRGVSTVSGPIKFAAKPSKMSPPHVEDLLKNPLFSDITLEVNGKQWHLHKCILASRSSVFAAMLKEKRANTILIEDVDSKIFDFMIRYIYSNDLQDVDEDTAVSLLFLSDRFDLPDLREKCEANLTSRVNPENCLTFLLNAEKCNATLLSTVAENILVANFSFVSKTEEWKNFAKTNFERSHEITYLLTYP